jgi:hypothetical protein
MCNVTLFDLNFHTISNHDNDRSVLDIRYGTVDTGRSDNAIIPFQSFNELAMLALFSLLWQDQEEVEYNEYKD